MIDHGSHQFHSDSKSLDPEDFLLAIVLEVLGRACDSGDVGSRGEKAAFACDDCESCVWVVVQLSQGGDCVFNEGTTKGVELLGPVELRDLVSMALMAV